VNWDDLTNEQRTVASTTERRVLAFGGAGSGKTTVALWCARQCLRSSQAKKWQRVLFLAFSRTAVREIARRSGQALDKVRDRVEIHTFHSFANRIITSFGRYAGLGSDLPRFQSDAEAKLLGRNEAQLGYDDLLPLALKVIRTRRVKRLLSERWPLIVCDEFHDTDDSQWELISELAESGRSVLFADPNQMIYDGFLGHRGVGPKRVAKAVQLADLVVDLGGASHRDPTNVIPAMAEAMRRRQFSDSAVQMALNLDRLRIYNSVVTDDLINLLRSEIASARDAGAQTIGIFGHGNEEVADLSARLFSAGVDHVLIGLPEAHGEALAALEALCLYGLGRLDVKDVRLRLAVFLTASVRRRTPPELAVALSRGTPVTEGLERRIEVTLEALRNAADEGLIFLIRAATESWPRLRITAGRRPWNQAARTFGAIAQQVSIRTRRVEDFVTELARRLSELRSETFFDLDISAGHSIQLMNFHQTKGREADVVVLVYREEDWFGVEQEPFPRNSRLLYVSLTRARYRNVVILPPNPHPLVAPFLKLLANQT
jgi:ATP-dependent DNA helicase UvrD/PcrA